MGQRLEYTLKNGSQSYEPFFQYCGFRYALLENWPEEVKGKNFEGIAVYSEMEYHGTFTCSNEKINRLVDNVRWSQKSNFVDIPGDCPTRERTGWTADISVFAETACYLSDPKKFLMKRPEDYEAGAVSRRKPALCGARLRLENMSMHKEKCRRNKGKVQESHFRTVFTSWRTLCSKTARESFPSFTAFCRILTYLPPPSVSQQLPAFTISTGSTVS